MSKFLFTCPQCNQQLEAEEEWIGMQNECPYCKQSIIIKKTQPAPAVVLKAAAPDEKPCPFCGQPIKKEAVFCKHCKRDLVEPKKIKVTCQYCAEEVEIPEDQQVDVICPSCGKSLSKPGNNPDLQPVSKTVNPIGEEKPISKFIKKVYKTFFWKTFLAIWITMFIPVFNVFALGGWIVYSIIIAIRKQTKYAGFVFCNALLAILLAGMIYGTMEKQKSRDKQSANHAEKKITGQSRYTQKESLYYVLKVSGSYPLEFRFDFNTPLDTLVKDNRNEHEFSKSFGQHSIRRRISNIESFLEYFNSNKVATSISYNIAQSTSEGWKSIGLITKIKEGGVSINGNKILFRKEDEVSSTPFVQGQVRTMYPLFFDEHVFIYIEHEFFMEGENNFHLNFICKRLINGETVQKIKDRFSKGY